MALEPAEEGGGGGSVTCGWTSRILPTYNKEEISFTCTHTRQFFPCRRRTVISKASRACLFSPLGQRMVIIKGKITHEDQLPTRRAALDENVHKCQFSPCGRRYNINTNLTSCLPAIGLESHPRCVELGSRDHRMRLIAPVRPQATCIPWRGADLRAGQRISRSLGRYTHNACKRCRGNGPVKGQRVRLLQPLIPHSQKDGGLRPILDLRLLNRAPMRRPFRMLTLKQTLVQIRQSFGSCLWIWKMLTFTSK